MISRPRRRDQIREYVVGLMFDEAMQKVVLIKKEHGPKCVVGFWNGVGGHVEPGEVPIDAMVREYREEAGVLTTPSDWMLFTELDGGPELESPEFRVSFYWGRRQSAVSRARTMTDERVGTFWVADIAENLRDEIVPNLSWMIPFLKDPGTTNYIPALCCTYEDSK